MIAVLLAAELIVPGARSLDGPIALSQLGRSRLAAAVSNSAEYRGAAIALRATYIFLSKAQGLSCSLR
jgi:hypothetical protein